MRYFPQFTVKFALVVCMCAGWSTFGACKKSCK